MSDAPNTYRRLGCPKFVRGADNRVSCGQDPGHCSTRKQRRGADGEQDHPVYPRPIAASSTAKLSIGAKVVRLIATDFCSSSSAWIETVRHRRRIVLSASTTKFSPRNGNAKTDHTATSDWFPFHILRLAAIAPATAAPSTALSVVLSKLILIVP